MKATMSKIVVIILNLIYNMITVNIRAEFEEALKSNAQKMNLSKYALIDPAPHHSFATL